MPSPRPGFEQRRAMTLFLRVPRVDWPRIAVGEKTEFRAAGRHALLRTHVSILPTPVVGYSFKRFRSEADVRLLLLEDVWSEPLGAISLESLQREGFDVSGGHRVALKEFRTYWRDRHQTVGFKPLSQVQVYRVRPFTADDQAIAAGAMLEHLYGRWL